MRRPHKPFTVSLWDLIARGYISFEHVDSNGKVDQTVITQAQEIYLRDHPQEQPTSHFTSRIPWNRSRDLIASHCISSSQTNRTNAISVDNTCCVCTNPKTHAFSPCYHYCICETCSHRITDRCPICRVAIKGCHRIWS